MKLILTHIFVALGVLFLILIIGGVIFVATDPYNLRPMIFGSPATGATYSSRPANNSGTSTDSQTASGEFYLSDQQKQALLSFGIDPSVVPNTISAEQEACFVSILGEARVNEIRAGTVPSAMEFFKAKACI